MPTYAYECAACGQQSEVVQRMSDAALTECPQCGAPGLRKLFHNVGVVFKGSGFYRTDSRDKRSKSSSSTSSSSTTSSSTSTGTPAASAPASAPASTPASTTPAPSSGSTSAS